MGITVTIDQVMEARTQSYNEGYNDALYEIKMKLERNPSIKIEDLIHQIEYMGRV